MVKQFRPMKAVQESLGFEDLQYPVYASIKFDGSFAVNLSGSGLSRSLKKFGNEWLTKQLSHELLSGFVGEVMNVDIDNPELQVNRSSLCRDTTSCTNTKVKEDWDFVWALFDYIGDADTTQDEELPYNEVFYQTRMVGLYHAVEMMSDVVREVELAGIKYELRDMKKILGYKFHVLVQRELHLLESPEQLEILYNKAVSMGFEGVVTRKPNSVYKFGRSTAKTQEFVRFKPQGDSEIIVTSFEQMYRNNNEAKVNELGYTERSSHQENTVAMDAVGAMIGYDINTLEEVKIGAGCLSWAEREEIWNNQESYLGKLAKYSFLDTGIKSKPRHPRFKTWRDVKDLDADNVVAIAETLGVSLNLGSKEK